MIEKLYEKHFTRGRYPVPKKRDQRKIFYFKAFIESQKKYGCNGKGFVSICGQNRVVKFQKISQFLSFFQIKIPIKYSASECITHKLKQI